MNTEKTTTEQTNPEPLESNFRYPEVILIFSPGPCGLKIMHEQEWGRNRSSRGSGGGGGGGLTLHFIFILCTWVEHTEWPYKLPKLNHPILLHIKELENLPQQQGSNHKNESQRKILKYLKSHPHLPNSLFTPADKSPFVTQPTNHISGTERQRDRERQRERGYPISKKVLPFPVSE